MGQFKLWSLTSQVKTVDSMVGAERFELSTPSPPELRLAPLRFFQVPSSSHDEAAIYCYH
jgi:hypothetical protein